MQESYAIREWCFDEVLKGKPTVGLSIKDVIGDAQELEYYIKSGELKEEKKD